MFDRAATGFWVSILQTYREALVQVWETCDWSNGHSLSGHRNCRVPGRYAAPDRFGRPHRARRYPPHALSILGDSENRPMRHKWAREHRRARQDGNDGWRVEGDPAAPRRYWNYPLAPGAVELHHYRPMPIIADPTKSDLPQYVRTIFACRPKPTESRAYLPRQARGVR
jgi:hypothetical protein